jgi:hypothetical protein
MTDWKSSLHSNPIPWLLDTACAPIRYRVLTELLDRGRDDPEVQQLRQEIVNYSPALKLIKKQDSVGMWANSIFAGDSRKYQNCTENALIHLFEYGWNREDAAIRLSSKTMRSFMTQKRDLKLYEFAKPAQADKMREKYYRWFLRILALGTLIRAGYGEERSRQAVLELLDLCAGFVDKPVSKNPTEEIGATHPLIRMEAWSNGYAFIPDLYIIRVLSSSEWLLDGELAKMRLKKIFDYILSPTYQKLAPALGLIRTTKGTFPKGNGLQFFTLDHYKENGNLDELLTFLEFFARMGLINRYPLLMSLLDWLQSLQQKDGRWCFPAKLINDSSRWTALLRIEKDWRSPARKEADLTFRMLLIIKHQWERQMLMLDRRNDGYPI